MGDERYQNESVRNTMI